MRKIIHSLIIHPLIIHPLIHWFRTVSECLLCTGYGKLSLNQTVNSCHNGTCIAILQLDVIEVILHGGMRQWRHWPNDAVEKASHLKMGRWRNASIGMWHLRGELRPATPISGEGHSEQEGETYRKVQSEKDGRGRQWGCRVVRETENGVEPVRKLRRSHGLWIFCRCFCKCFGFRQGMVRYEIMCIYKRSPWLMGWD